MVGPRPNVKRETDLYTSIEKGLLTVKPGITDFSSIVFSDENDILKECSDPDIGYNQLIRPWKSRLGLIYVENQNLFLDIKLIIITLVAVISRSLALNYINRLLCQINVSEDIVKVAKKILRSLTILSSRFKFNRNKPIRFNTFSLHN